MSHGIKRQYATGKTKRRRQKRDRLIDPKMGYSKRKRMNAKKQLDNYQVMW